MAGIKAKKKKLQECKVQRGLKTEREKKRRETWIALNIWISFVWEGVFF